MAHSYNSRFLNVTSQDLDELLPDKTALLAPLIIHHRWTEGQFTMDKVFFFPFIAYRFIEGGANPVRFSDARERRSDVL